MTQYLNEYYWVSFYLNTKEKIGPRRYSARLGRLCASLNGE